MGTALGVVLLFWTGCDRSDDVEWPARGIRIYVGWSAGGSSDTTTRAVALGMEKQLGQKILVTNVTGAMGSIGGARVAEAPPDGYLWFGGGAVHGGFFMSPGFVPLLTGSILAWLSLWYTLSTLLRNSTASPGPWIRSWLGDQEKRRVLVIIAITAIYAVGMLGRVPFLWMAAIFTRLGAMVISPWFIRILSIPREILLPVAASLCVLGAWASGFSRFDVAAMFGFGLVGPLADVHLRRTLLSYSENPTQILTRSIGLVLLALLLFTVISQFRNMRKKKD